MAGLGLHLAQRLPSLLIGQEHVRAHVEVGMASRAGLPAVEQPAPATRVERHFRAASGGEPRTLLGFGLAFGEDLRDVHNLESKAGNRSVKG